MFRRPMAWLLVAILGIALLFRLPLLALLCTLLLLAAGVAWIWNRYALVRLTYSAAFSTATAFPDDEIELQLRVANRKPLPLVVLIARELLPAGLTALTERVDRDFHGRQVLSRKAGIGWYEGLTWHYRVRCDARGAYQLGPASIEAGDPFGFFRAIRDEPRATHLLVYPRLLPLAELRLPAQHPIGNLRARQLIRDPMRIAGTRDYHPDDPLKDIHWAATAKVGALQTRVYETTTERTLALFLDLDTFERYWEGINPEQIERMISAAATLATQGLHEGYAVGLYVNGAPAEQAQAARIPPSRSPAQLERIMQALAGLTHYSLTPMARLLHSEAAKLPWGSSVLLLSVIAPDTTRAAILALRQRGRAVTWLWMADTAPPTLPEAQIIHIPSQADWRRAM